MPIPESIAEHLGNQSARPSAAQVLRDLLETAEVPDGTNGAVHAYSGEHYARQHCKNNNQE